MSADVLGVVYPNLIGVVLSLSFVKNTHEI
jgi:hypothetical protein